MLLVGRDMQSIGPEEGHVSFDRSLLASSEAERLRLQTVLDQLSDEDLTQPLGDGWTTAGVLAHLAFWDRRALVLLERWEREGVSASPSDSQIINDAALPQWMAIPAAEARRQWLETAEAIDRSLARMSQETLDQIAAEPDTIALHRGEHREEHFQQIERGRAQA